MSTFKLKANHAPVKAYYDTLERFGRGKFDNEGNIRRAFESLLEKCARPFEWLIVPEYQIPRTGKSPLRLDAAVLDAFNLSRGCSSERLAVNKRVQAVRLFSGFSGLMDNLSKQERSERMSRIKGVDTGPEMTVRRMVHGMGFRYRLHARDFPGVPDMAFPRLGKIIFVHGCFWHQHPGCGRQPKSHLDFWTKKLFQNRERDLRNQRKLRSLGWRILIVWESDC